MSGDTKINVPVAMETKGVLSKIQETVAANWQKHRVAILAGTALVAGGLAIALTGGLAAIPGAVALGLIASGVFGTTGGFAFMSYYASRPTQKVEDITMDVAPGDEAVGGDDLALGEQQPPVSPLYVQETPPKGGFLPYVEKEGPILDAYTPEEIPFLMPTLSNPTDEAQSTDSILDSQSSNDPTPPLEPTTDLIQGLPYSDDSTPSLNHPTRDPILDSPNPEMENSPVLSPTLAEKAVEQESAEIETPTSPKGRLSHLDRSPLPTLSKDNTLDVAAFCADAKQNAVWTKPISTLTTAAPTESSTSAPSGPLEFRLMPEFSPPLSYAAIASKTKTPAAAPSPLKTPNTIATPVANKPQITPSSAPQKENDDGWFTIVKGKRQKSFLPTPTSTVSPAEKKAESAAATIAVYTPSPVRLPDVNGNQSPKATLSKDNTLDVAAFCADAKQNAVWTKPISTLTTAAPTESSTSAPSGPLEFRLMPEFSPPLSYAAIASKPKIKTPAAAPSPLKTPNTIATPVANKPQITPSSAPQKENDDGWFTIVKGKRQKSFLPTPTLTVSPAEKKAESAAATIAVYTPSPVRLPDVNGNQSPKAPTETSNGKIATNSYLPSARKTRQMVGLALGAGLAGCAIYAAATMSPEERQARLDALQKGFSDVASSLNIFPTANETSLLPLGTDATNRFGPMNQCVVPALDDCRRGYVEYYSGKLMGAGNLLMSQTGSLLTQASQSTLSTNLQDCAVGVQDYLTPGMNVTAAEVVECCPLTSNLGLPNVPLPSPKLVLAGGAAILTTGLALTDGTPSLPEEEESELQNDEIPDNMKLIPDDVAPKTEEKKKFVPSSGSKIAQTGKLVGLAFAGMATIYGAYRWSQMTQEERELFLTQASTNASWTWNAITSLPDAAGKWVENWANDTTWGDTAKSWTQWAANADPIGAGNQMTGNLATQVSESSVGQTVGQWAANVQTCASAAEEYLTASEASPGQIQTLSDPLPLEQLGVPFVDLSQVVEPAFMGPQILPNNTCSRTEAPSLAALANIVREEAELNAKIIRTINTAFTCPLNMLGAEERVQEATFIGDYY